MTDLGGNQVKTFAAGFLGFAGVVGVGSLALLHRGGSVAAAPVVEYAPVDTAATLTVPPPAGRAVLSGAPQGAAAESSPAPLLSDEVRDAVPAAGAPAASAGGNAAPVAPSTFAAGRPFDAGASATSSAQEASSSSSSAPKKRAKKPFSPPKLDLSKNRSAVASMVHYGVSDRAQLMGRAVGPVYNFSGKDGGNERSAQVAAASMDVSGALRQVDDAQKQVDSSSGPSGDKARLDQGLSQVRQTIEAPVASGQ